MGFVMLKQVITFFKEAAKENKERKQYRLEAAEEQYKKDKVRVDGRVNLRRRIEEELSPRNCPAEEIVSRFQSVIDDEHFLRFIGGETYSSGYYKNYFELSDVFKKAGLDISLYKNDAMVTLFIEKATDNARRILPEDAVDFMKTLLERKDYGTFTELDMEWHKRDDGKPLKDFLARGLVPLAGRVHEEDKVEFFHACESSMFVRIMGEEGNPEDFAAFMYNIFGNMDLYEVDNVLSQSDCMVMLKELERDNPVTQAFDDIVGKENTALANTLKKYIGWKPLEDQKLHLSNEG